MVILLGFVGLRRWCVCVWEGGDGVYVCGMGRGIRVSTAIKTDNMHTNVLKGIDDMGGKRNIMKSINDQPNSSIQLF